MSSAHANSVLLSFFPQWPDRFVGLVFHKQTAVRPGVLNPNDKAHCCSHSNGIVCHWQCLSPCQLFYHFWCCCTSRRAALSTFASKGYTAERHRLQPYQMYRAASFLLFCFKKHTSKATPYQPYNIVTWKSVSALSCVSGSKQQVKYRSLSPSSLRSPMVV